MLLFLFFILLGRGKEVFSRSGLYCDYTKPMMDLHLPSDYECKIQEEQNLIHGTTIINYGSYRSNQYIMADRCDKVKIKNTCTYYFFGSQFISTKMYESELDHGDCLRMDDSREEPNCENPCRWTGTQVKYCYKEVWTKERLMVGARSMVHAPGSVKTVPLQKGFMNVRNSRYTWDETQSITGNCIFTPIERLTCVMTIKKEELEKDDKIVKATLMNIHCSGGANVEFVDFGGKKYCGGEEIIPTTFESALTMSVLDKYQDRYFQQALDPNDLIRSNLYSLYERTGWLITRLSDRLCNENRIMMSLISNNEMSDMNIPVRVLLKTNDISVIKTGPTSVRVYNCERRDVEIMENSECCSNPPIDENSTLYLNLKTDIVTKNPGVCNCKKNLVISTKNEQGECINLNSGERITCVTNNFLPFRKLELAEYETMNYTEWHNSQQVPSAIDENVDSIIDIAESDDDINGSTFIDNSGSNFYPIINKIKNFAQILAFGSGSLILLGVVGYVSMQILKCCCRRSPTVKVKMGRNYTDDYRDEEKGIIRLLRSDDNDHSDELDRDERPIIKRKKAKRVNKALAPSVTYSPITRNNEGSHMKNFVAN
jgi:hypothetical protein